MLVNFFKKTNPVNFIIIIGLFFIYFFIAVYNTYEGESLSVYLLLEIGGEFLLLVAILYFFNILVFRVKLRLNGSYTLLFFILFLSFFFKEFLRFNVLVMFTLYVFFLKRLYLLRFTKTIFQILFDCGLLLGILFLLEPYTMMYVVLLYVSLFLFHKITLRTLIITIIGMSTPLLFYFAYSFWYDKVDEFFQIFHFSLNFNGFIYLKDQFLLPLILMCFFTIGAILLKSIKVITESNRYKKSWILILFNLLISIIVILLISKKTGSELLFFLLPATIIVVSGVETIENGIVKDVILGILIVSSFLTPFVL